MTQPHLAGRATPTGAPCPRTVRTDGSVEGSGDCCCCGYCLLLEWAAWDDSTQERALPELGITALERPAQPAAVTEW